jgi:hypothetical protein
MLTDVGLVSRKIYGETPIYSINKDGSMARTIIELFTRAKF